MDVKERLKLFIKYLGLTNQQFEINVGVSNGYIANMREGVGKTGLERISQKYPELNIGWLLTGEGYMLKSSSQENKDTAPLTESGEPSNRIQQLEEVLKIKDQEVQELRQRLKEKEQLVGGLLEIIKNLTEK